MKIEFLLSSLSLALASQSFAARECVDLSGKYRPPYETDSSEVVTTITYAQSGCDTLSISGVALGKPHFESETTAYAPQTMSLKGHPVPEGLDCLYNSYPGICASYLATALYTSKTLDQEHTSLASDPNHGGCMFTTSFLSKDPAGNLVEIPQASSCEDGFRGAIAPVVWPKADQTPL